MFLTSTSSCTQPMMIVSGAFLDLLRHFLIQPSCAVFEVSLGCLLHPCPSLHSFPLYMLVPSSLLLATGCRELVKESFSKLYPGLLQDMADWTVDTRRQAAKLMLTLLRYERGNATMHLQKVRLATCVGWAGVVCYQACCVGCS